MKAVIPVAGLGTRMLPATKAIPKEMLPIVDRPLIQYIVEEVTAAGIKEIVLVTHSSKNSIENHFDTSFELEATLERPKDVTIIHVRQGEAKGLGHAVECARPIVGDAPFAVVLPDVILDNASCNLSKDNLADMLSRFNETGNSQIMVEKVADEDVDKFGIVNINGNDLLPGGSTAIKNIVEKPNREDAPSNLAVVGRYVLDKSIWPLLKQPPLGAGNEIQLTDAIAMLMKEQQVDAYYMKGKSHDCGSKLGYMKANIEYALRRDELKDELKAYIKALL